ncbi:NAD(P)/FAD-dependent oxidoreductase [Streptomyces sp. C1-2]|uniref:FAD-dependent oxidoreductase n=1 Tax=Streptomyces sp. C1-2 TaxID=2720022 RepID=UPI00143243A6|nr:NAD(P)/FAD-dependent oxidoreductase [Streptomyces sp. C1-2]NJP74697.1 FAD-dependent monooxygenase [Streptomyces sp. C1-2]
MNVDVVVCGAGVGGLAAACALGRLGLRVLLLEKQPRPRPVAKGEVFQPGALRVLREWGVSGLLERAGALRLDRLVARDRDGTARMALDYRRLPVDGNWLLAHDYPAILRAFTEALPPSVELRRGVLADEPARSPDGRVTGVTLTEDGARRTVSAALVVAADGISSRLRRAAGIDLDRREYPHRLVAMELTGAPEVEADFSAYVTAHGLRLRYPLPGGRIRLYAQAGPGELRGAGPGELDRWAAALVRDTPALAPLEDAIHEALPRRQTLPVVRALAPRLAVPGLALVGDCGHVVHPMAAQGMNSAVADADRLAEVLRECGDLTAASVDRALHAYGRARHADLVQVGRTSHNAARMVTDLSWTGRLLGRRALRYTGANDRIRYTVMHNMAGLGAHPLTPLDRLHQIGLLPDPRARRRPVWA